MNLSKNFERCLKATRELGREYPYYTPASLRVRFEDSDKCPTMCIDSKLVIKYNDQFVTNLDDNQLKAVILHEIMHYMAGHHKRYMENPHKGEYPWMLHNVAMDIEINQFLDRSHLPDGGQTPEKYKLPEGKCYEEYLLMLIKDCEKITINMGSNQPGQSDGDQNDQSQGQSKCGDVDCTGYDKEDGTAGSENQDESTRRELVAECEASEAESKQKGNGHSFSDQMKKVEKIRYPWKKVFKSLISNRLSERVRGFNYRTYHKPNKHLMGVDKSVIHGSYCDLNEHIDLVIGIDISGSMYGLVEKMYGIMKSIIDIEEMDISTTILECDTQVSKVVHDFDFDKAEVKVGSGGGTDMGAISQYVQDQKWNPDLIVIMTDNYTDWDPVLFKSKTVVLTTNVTKECPYKQFLVSF